MKKIIACVLCGPLVASEIAWLDDEPVASHRFSDYLEVEDFVLAETDFDVEEKVPVEKPVESDIMFTKVMINPEEEVAIVTQEELKPVDVPDFIFVPGDSKYPKGFSISTKKVTNREYEQFVQAIHHKAPLHWGGNKAPIGLENHPVVNVSYRDAFLYVVWAGKRLPKDEELRRALYLENSPCDFNDKACEWTATPFFEEQKMVSPSAHLGERVRASHYTFGNKGMIAILNTMGNEESNSYTGFRVVTDVQ